ncbi:hypothetical protein MFLO_10738 [Listeria floridensis FSL S10-1187]|uniref:Gram-positive cocci surface proteins LPxTG domain-containing protein n=1 Tax=Listeria floridensis FSL S10-1187 TaxID=1265817 RepID=A0ABN0RE04_9LIST|nr:LPXTG cell wall anchor domain-containing protein [Listeria floridensis]EUJ30293.1 hypothetical protein MFLO_10738 [Listeria floridensis FSL S10-1187]
MKLFGKAIWLVLLVGICLVAPFHVAAESIDSHASIQFYGTYTPPSKATGSKETTNSGNKGSNSSGDEFRIPNDSQPVLAVMTGKLPTTGDSSSIPVLVAGVALLVGGYLLLKQAGDRRWL